MKDYYKLLGVHIDATEVDIKKAYRKKALENHPDTLSSDEKKIDLKKMKDLNEAYNTLKSKGTRAQYDLEKLLKDEDSKVFHDHASPYVMHRELYDEWKDDNRYRKIMIFLWVVLGFIAAIIVTMLFTFTPSNYDTGEINIRENNLFPEDVSPYNFFETDPQETIIKEI